MLRQNLVRIDLDAIRHNYRILQKHVGERVKVMAVIKANAYGHGMVECARALAAIGVDHFAVASPEEGVELRLAGVEGEILVLGPAMPRAAQEAIRHSLTQTVFTPEMVGCLNAEAQALGMQALVHVKLDTGMNRIGLRSCEEAQALADALKAAPHVKVTGVYTHFADADDPESPGALNDFSQKQLERFEKLRQYFDAPAHAANSAVGIIAPKAWFGMVREGISLYGYPPVPTDLPFRPALKWSTEVTHVKTVHAGDTIGYGRTFTAERDMRVATIAVGYGDGYHRAASNRGSVLIRGRRAPILGRVCMDQTMVDVSAIAECEVGDEAVLIGTQGESAISAEDVAEWAQTISYEVLLAITPRVPRVFDGADVEKSE